MPRPSALSALPVRSRDRERLVRGDVVFRALPGTLFADTPRATDARQGVIGDCYLLSAFSALAQADPAALRSLIHDNSDGTYTARFFRRPLSGGPPETVIIDGSVPVRASDGRPIYARSAARKDGVLELWPLLCEKAYAAWRGGYGVVGEGGMVEETLEELTGQPTKLRFTAEVHPEVLWRLLVRATAEGWPATVCTYGRQARPGLDELGIHPNHILIFMGVHTWKGRRIVSLRDPFDTPAVGHLVLPDAHGVTTLSFDHFVNYFAELILNGRDAASISIPPHPRVSLTEIFARSYILDRLSDGDRRAIAADFRPVTVAAGEPVIVQGAESRGYFLIRHGRAAVEARDPKTGRTRRLAFLRAGDNFGEGALLSGGLPAATVRAQTDLALYRVSPDHFHKWIHRYPEFVQRLKRRFNLLAHTQRWSRRSLTSLSLNGLLEASQEVAFRKGQALFRKGERPDAFYLVLEGQVAVLGGAGVQRQLGSGETFGEVPLDRRGVRPTTAQALTAGRLLKIDLDQADKAFLDFDVGQRQLEFLARRSSRALRKGR